MITLYGHPYSHNARKVHWALEELGVAHKYEVVDLMTGAQKKPDFMRLNPNARVPVMRDGDFVLYESNAMLLYLAETAGNGQLFPAKHPQRAHALQWLSWQASDLAGAMLDPFLMKFYATLGQPFDEAKHAASVAATKRPLEVLESSLVGRKHLVGNELSIADIAVAESIGLADFAGVPLAPYPAIRAWFEPLTLRPAFAKTRPTG